MYFQTDFNLTCLRKYQNQQICTCYFHNTFCRAHLEHIIPKKTPKYRKNTKRHHFTSLGLGVSGILVVEIARGQLNLAEI